MWGGEKEEETNDSELEDARMVVRRNTSIFFHLPLNFLEFFFLVDRTHSQIGQLLSKPSLFRQSVFSECALPRRIRTRAR